MVVDFIQNTGNRKPLDVGCGSLSASILPDGRILSLNGYHRKHGFITLSSIEQFPNDKWYDSDFVRAYRRRVAAESAVGCNSFGFGITPLCPVNEVNRGFIDLSHPFYVSKLANGLVVYALFSAIRNGEQDFLVNQITVVNETKEGKAFPFDFGGMFHLHRCSYGQLTEGGPIPMPSPQNIFRVWDGHFIINNEALPACCDITLSLPEGCARIPAIEKGSSDPIDFHYDCEFVVPAGSSRTITVVYSFRGDPDAKYNEPDMGSSDIDVSEMRSCIEEGRQSFRGGKNGMNFRSSFVIARNVDYILSCCSVPVTESAVSIITDHQLLPLSWNRDAYYMVHLLLTVARAFLPKELEFLRDAHAERIRRIVRGHLLWMFKGTRLPEGYWGRSYLANGVCKDKIYQLDQQCYPLLELRDYLSLFADEELILQIGPEVLRAVKSLLSRKEKHRYLFSTSETPADDSVNLPYHFSSHVLLWYTFQRLSDLCKRFQSLREILEEVEGISTGQIAEEIKAECLLTFSVNHEGKPLFAYLSDGDGATRIYHDANDLPVILAPLWRFVGCDDERWVNTMNFAFCTENREGYFDGVFGGLGSTHTPHPWPLGYAQELLFLQLAQNRQFGQNEALHVTSDAGLCSESSHKEDQRVQNVLRKMADVMMWDGLFGEAVNKQDGHVESRTWFSWPGAFVSDVLLLLSRNGSWV